MRDPPNGQHVFSFPHPGIAAVVHSGQHDRTSLFAKTLSMDSWPDGDIWDVFKGFSHCSIWHAKILLAPNPNKASQSRHQRALMLLGGLDVLDTEILIHGFISSHINSLLSKPYSPLFTIHSKSSCRGSDYVKPTIRPLLTKLTPVHSVSLSLRSYHQNLLTVPCFCRENLGILYLLKLYLQCRKF